MDGAEPAKLCAAPRLPGDVLAARDLAPEALSEYQKALQLDANWPDIHLLMGNLLDCWGDGRKPCVNFKPS